METELKQRLLKFIKYLGLSQNAFLISVGLSAGYMAKVRNVISPKTLNKMLIVYPRLNTEWLLSGKGNMIKSKTSIIQKPHPKSEGQLFAAKTKAIVDAPNNIKNSATNELPQYDKTNNYAPRIKLIRDSLFGGSNRKFAEKTGVSSHVASVWCTVKAGNKIINKIVRKLPQINKDWLLTGTGSMTLNNEQIINLAINDEKQTNEDKEKTSLEQSFEALVRLTEHNMNSLDKLVAMIESERKEKDDLIKENTKLLKEKDELIELLSKYSSHAQQYKNSVREQNTNYIIKIKENNNDKKN